MFIDKKILCDGVIDNKLFSLISMIIAVVLINKFTMWDNDTY